MQKKAFTLIEVLLVVVIIGILASIVIVAVNPTRQIEQANDTKRQSDVTAILNALYQYSIDNGGSMPAAVPNTAIEIGVVGVTICPELVPDYLAEMPFDPQDTSYWWFDCSDYQTGYTVMEDAISGRITIAAPNAAGDPISVTR